MKIICIDLKYTVSQKNTTLLITVSQGSVATSLRFVGLCSDNFVANFVPSLAVNEI